MFIQAPTYGESFDKNRDTEINHMLSKKISATAILYISIVSLYNFALAQGPQISLAWESSNDPNLSHYIIYRDTISGSRIYLDKIGGNLSSYIDTTVQLGKTYYYKLTAVNEAGQESMPSREVSVTIAALHRPELSAKNKPDPIYQKSVIGFIISKPGEVFISIFNWQDQKVWEHQHTYEIIGKHLIEWDGKDLNGKYVPSGRYYYQVTTDQ